MLVVMLDIKMTKIKTFVFEVMGHLRRTLQSRILKCPPEVCCLSFELALLSFNLFFKDIN